MNKKGLLFFQSILLSSIGSFSYALEDTKVMRNEQYTTIPKMLIMLQPNSDDIDNILGGAGTTKNRSQTIINKILIAPTNIFGDIGTLNRQLIINPTGNLQTDLTTTRGLIFHR